MLTIILSGLTWIWVKVRQIFAAVPMKTWAVLVGLIVLAAFVVFAFRSCRSEPKIDQEQVIELQEQIKEGNRKEAERVAADFAAKQAVIDNDLSGNLKAIEEAEAKAKADVKKLSDAELKQRILELSQ